MPNKPKTFKCVKPGCNRVFTKNADFVAHHGKCVLGIYDALKCSSCGEGFSNSHYWKKHRRNCLPVKKSLLLPLAERLKLAEEKKSSSIKLDTDEKVDDDDVIDYEFEEINLKSELDEVYDEIMSPEHNSLPSAADSQCDIEDDNNEDSHNVGSNDSSSSKKVYVYSLVDPRSIIPSYTCIPSFEEKAVDVKKEEQQEDDDEVDEFIEEYLDEDFEDESEV